MTIGVSEQRRKQLDEIVGLMNKEAELKLYYEEGSEEWKHADEILHRMKKFAEMLDDHERGYLEQGLMDKKEIHDVYWPAASAKTQHKKEKMARLDQDGKTRSDEEWRRV
ncbi:MAG: hypothetical protein LUO79_08155 [Methanomassiliicoccales archaeon]|nr:hypothetical protein [Methanomassiliicoccales archaeon]